MNSKILVVGIDISKDDFQACIKERSEDGNVKIKGSRKFSNTITEFNEFTMWVAKRATGSRPVTYVMEATGSYHEDLAYYLYEAGGKVCVELPNKIKHFAQSLNVKTKTDKVDSAMIAQIGVERQLPAWIPMAPEYRILRDLCRERLSLRKECNRANNQLHAMRHSHEKMAYVIELKEAQIRFYEEAIESIEREIKKIVGANPTLKERINNIEKVKGIRLATIVTVLCETNGFHLFNSIRQVVSYAGLDVKMKESGKYIGESRISKKGNARIRQCLFMPALSATQHNDKIKLLYDRIVERNPKAKKKGVTAAMRKLLILIFVLWRKNEAYNLNYEWNV